MFTNDQLQITNYPKFYQKLLVDAIGLEPMTFSV